VFNGKKNLSHIIYRYVSLMVTSSAGGEPRYIYGLYTIERNEEGFFFQHGCPHNIMIGPTSL
jgi:hypothetical protein